MYISNIDREHLRSLDERREIRETQNTDGQIDCQNNEKVIQIIKDIRSLSLQNTEFRKKVIDGQNLEITVMSINPNEEIGVEVHENSDQFLFIELSYGEAITLDENGNIVKTQQIAPGDGIFVPKGTYHNIKNLGNYPMKLTSFYAPPVD